MSMTKNNRVVRIEVLEKEQETARYKIMDKKSDIFSSFFKLACSAAVVAAFIALSAFSEYDWINGPMGIIGGVIGGLISVVVFFVFLLGYIMHKKELNRYLLMSSDISSELIWFETGGSSRERSMADSKDRRDHIGPRHTPKSRN